jgi:deoxyadenosine/deoxycytidine kinase
MSTRDFENYFTLFNLMSSLIEPPELLLYLSASVPTLFNQIQKMGRVYENSIRIDYLKRLNERYEAWIESYKLGKVLIIEADAYDFPDNTDHLRQIIDKIDAELHGLF